MKKDPHNINFSLTNLSGEIREYNLQPLKRKDAAYVAHTFLQTLLKGFSEATAGASDKAESQSRILKALGEIEFETIWGLASMLLKYASVKTETETIVIDDLEKSDYFAENPDEIYLVIFHGIKENFPKVFSKVRDRLAAIGGDLIPDDQTESA